MSLKEKIKIKLESSSDYISGQDIAKEFGVSRAAVWKAVKQLKDEGFGIDSVSSKGYRLDSPADLLSKQEIETHLDSCAKGINIEILESVDSTNNEAKRRLANGETSDMLIIANEQTCGRGRLGRSFYSPKNTGIYMSFLIHTELELTDAVSVTTAASVAVVKAIEKVTDIRPEIKWVNDVYVGGKKVCGILTEAVSDFETGTARSVIIGIGINITTDVFPDEIKHTASSIGSRKPVRNKIIAQTANELLGICKDLSDKSSYIEFYKNHSMIIGKSIDFYINNVKHTATAEDIDNNGGLIVRLADGTIRTLSSGEVTVRLSDIQ